jgi:UPF0716 protein FxsA
VSLRLRLGCLLAIAYPFIEVIVAVLIAGVVGWWWLLVYAVACVVLGLGLVRYALGATGRSLGLAVAELRGPGDDTTLALEGTSLRSPTPPARTLLIVPAGLLIAIPGVMTTVVGLILWMPPTRTRIAARMERAARRWGPPPPGA